MEPCSCIVLIHTYVHILVVLCTILLLCLMYIWHSLHVCILHVLVYILLFLIVFIPVVDSSAYVIHAYVHVLY